MLLPFSGFFLYWRPFFIFLISWEKYKHSIRSKTIFLRGKLKCGFPEKLNGNGKRLSFTFRNLRETSLTALSARYLNFFVIVPRDWWDSSICLSYGLVLFLYVLLFLILRIFSMFFFSSILQLFIFKFPLLRKCYFIN